MAKPAGGVRVRTRAVGRVPAAVLALARRCRRRRDRHGRRIHRRSVLVVGGGFGGFGGFERAGHDRPGISGAEDGAAADEKQLQLDGCDLLYALVGGDPGKALAPPTPTRCLWCSECCATSATTQRLSSHAGAL